MAEDKISEVTGKMSAMADTVSAKAGQNWDKLESIFEQRTAKAMNKLGVPTAKDVDALSQARRRPGRGSGPPGGGCAGEEGGREKSSGEEGRQEGAGEEVASGKLSARRPRIGRPRTAGRSNEIGARCAPQASLRGIDSGTADDLHRALGGAC